MNRESILDELQVSATQIIGNIMVFQLKVEIYDNVNVLMKPLQNHVID